MNPNTVTFDTVTADTVTVASMVPFLRRAITAMLCFLGLMLSSGAAGAQEPQQPLGKAFTRTALPIFHRLNNFQYHAKTDSWYPKEDSSPNADHITESRPLKGEPNDFVDFDPKVWQLHGEEPNSLFDNANQDAPVNQFVSLVRRPSDAHQEARIYARQQGLSTFQFVCRGSQPSSGSRGFEQTAPDSRFCFLNGRVAFVWDNSAITALDSEVDSIVWTNDQRHIVYARRHGDGHQLIAYSIADDDYSMLVSIPKSLKAPALFPDASDGVFVVTSGTDLRNISLPPAATLPKFESLNQIPILYRSVDHKILAVREVESPDQRRADNRLIDAAEQTNQGLTAFKVRISVPK